MKVIQILFLLGVILINASISFGQWPDSLDQEAEVLNLDWLKKVKIGYPEIARNLLIDGINRFEILVDSTGKYITHQRLDPPLPILTPKIESVLHLLEFKPAQANGQPVEAWTKVDFRFHMFNGGRWNWTDHHHGLEEMQKQNYQAALEHFDQAILLDDAMNINAQMQRAVAISMIGDTTASIQAFQNILAKKPAFDAIWGLLIKGLHGKSVYYTEEKNLFFALEEKAFKLLEEVKNKKLQMLMREIRKAYFVEL